MMKRIGVFVLLLLFFFFAREANASLLVVKNNGEVVWNVLAISDQLALGVPQKSEISISDVVGDDSTDKSILLKKDDTKILLNVGDSKEMDVTNLSDNLIEIEERGNVRKVNIGIVDGKFAIEQSSIVAKTDLPISINPKENELSVVTPSGAIFLSVLPLDAVETALRSKLMSKIIDKNLDLSERELGVVTYAVRGEKEIKLFNIIDVKVPVTTFISTTTGEIIFIDQPKWLSVMGFLFS